MILERVWVTGAHGMLGRAVCAQLARDGVPWIGTDHELDITDAAAVERFAAAERFKIAIHCAAYTAVDRCESDEAAATAVNADGAGHVARAAAARGAAMVHVSTDYVFPGDAERPYVEDDATGPVNAYGRSKLLGEQAVLAAAGARAYVVRTSWLFGPDGPNFVATMRRLFAERPEVRVVGDQHGRPTYAPDLAAALIAIGRQRPAPGIYHWANEGATTWHGLASAVRDELAADVAVTAIATADYPTPARRPAWSVLDTRKFAAALPDVPMRPWRAALEEYLRS